MHSSSRDVHRVIHVLCDAQRFTCYFKDCSMHSRFTQLEQKSLNMQLPWTRLKSNWTSVLRKKWVGKLMFVWLRRVRSDCVLSVLSFCVLRCGESCLSVFGRSDGATLRRKTAYPNKRTWLWVSSNTAQRVVELTCCLLYTVSCYLQVALFRVKHAVPQADGRVCPFESTLLGF